MDKLIILSGGIGLGGTTVSLSLILKGFEQYGASDRLCVLVHSGSLVEQYLQQAGQTSYLHSIEAEDTNQFFRRAFQWIAQQPKNWPLLLENATARSVMQTMFLMAPALRLSGRPIYHTFRDLADSENGLGNLVRKLIFTCLAPDAICNSQFTAEQVRSQLLPKIKAVLYPPVDTNKFQLCSSNSPPELLKPILQSGAHIILTPSRISSPEKPNDKNLRTLVSVIAQLKTRGHHYHGIVIGPDYDPEQLWTRQLLEQAKNLGVEDRFSVLPPTFSIKDYYDYADVVVTLAPREPFGRTVVEAIACGVPVVGSSTGGISEILGNFAPEWRVDPFDPEVAAQTIISIANDPNTPNILAEGRRWVEQQCNPVQYAKRLLEITGLALMKPLQNEHNNHKLANV